MAALGLLQGFGRGISQGAELLNRGMAEDREAERQRMREESIAKRWKRQEQREDARNKVADDRYKDQTERQDRLDKAAVSESTAQQQYRKDSLALQRDELNVKISERRRAEIEGKLGGLQREYEKGAESLDRRYERLIDSAKQTDQQNGFAKDKDGYTETDKAYMARDKALASLSSEFTAKMVPVVRSYGDELKGTAFSSYLDDVKAEDARQKDHAGKQFLRDAGVIDAEGKFTEQQPQAKQSGRGDLVNQIVGAGGNAEAGQSAMQPAEPLKPGLLSGLYSGLSGDYRAAPIDYSTITPLQRVSTAAGRAVTYYPGKLLDNAEMLNDNVVQPAWQWANTPIINPGETPQQYAARTGIKR